MVVDVKSRFLLMLACEQNLPAFGLILGHNTTNRALEVIQRSLC